MAPETGEGWEAYAEALRERVLSEVVFAGVPAAIVQGRPRVEWGETLRPGEGYVVRKLRYEAYPGMWVPAMLYQPDPLPGRVPVILNVNGHVGPIGKAQDYEQIRCINLAKQGMLALHPEWLSFGELEGAENEHDVLPYLDLCGHSGVSIFYLHLAGGLDVLLDLPQADPARAAVTGLSGGGWQAILLGALDTRIAATIPNAGYIGQLWRVFNVPDMGDAEQQPNDLVAVADYVHLTALLAPRPALLIYNSYDDCCFMAHRAWHSLYLPVKPLYERLGAGENFLFHENADPGTHNYDEDNRRALYRFLQRHFFDSEAEVAEAEVRDELLSKEALTVGLPEDNATLASLAADSRATCRAGASRPRTARCGPERRGLSLRDLLRFSPLAVTQATLMEEQVWEDGRRRTWDLQLGPEWAVPAVEYEPANAEAPVAVVVADGGREASMDRVAELWGSGHHVFAVDVHLVGELVPRGMPGLHLGAHGSDDRRTAAGNPGRAVAGRGGLGESRRDAGLRPDDEYRGPPRGRAGREFSALTTRAPRSPGHAQAAPGNGARLSRPPHSLLLRAAARVRRAGTARAVRGARDRVRGSVGRRAAAGAEWCGLQRPQADLTAAGTRSPRGAATQRQRVVTPTAPPPASGRAARSRRPGA